MKAIVVREDRLVWEEVETPEPGPGEVRIAVKATAVNRADLVQRTGLYPPPPGASDILGLECAGVIEAVGPGVSTERIGDEVIALLAGGGYAERVVCPASHVLPCGRLSWTEAAAVMEVFATAFVNLKVEGELKAGERVLLHAAASGVGTAALQLLRAWGNPVFATVGSAEKEQRCRELGAEQTHDRHRGEFVELVKEWGGADVVLDPVGGSYLMQNLRAMNKRGRLVSIGLLGGREAMLPMGLVLVKRLTIRGSVLRSRSIVEKDAVMAGLREHVWPRLMDGTLEPVIDQVLPIEQAEQAHERVRSNATVGKVVLAVDTQ